MAILGDNATPGAGFWSDVTGNKQYWTTNQWAMPAGGGIVTDINVYCAGFGGAVTGQLLIWDSSGNIIWQSGNLTLPGGSATIHGQSWVHASIPSVYLPAANYVLGFWSSGNVVWTFEGTGGATGRSGLASPGTATGGGDEYSGAGYGRLGAYVVYTPGGIMRVRRGGSWTTAQVFVRRSGAWVPATVFVRRGGVWVPAT
jgi:hypothetical protein